MTLSSGDEVLLSQGIAQIGIKSLYKCTPLNCARLYIVQDDTKKKMSHEEQAMMDVMGFSDFKAKWTTKVEEEEDMEIKDERPTYR